MHHASLTRHLPVAVGASAVAMFAAAPAIAGADRVRADGPPAVYSAAVPADAAARVEAVYDSAGDTIITLQARGLKPGTEYGAHAHANACGLTGAAGVAQLP